MKMKKLIRKSRNS